MTYLNLLIGLFLSTSVAASGGALSTQVNNLNAHLTETAVNSGTNIPEVPFYSQFSDIQSPKWQKVGCGIASLAMLIDFYHPGIVSVENLLKEGIAADAFNNDAGWSHEGLALLAGKYNLKGAIYDLSRSDADAAFSQFEKLLKEGPAIASVHYKFDPKNPIPHLVVITGVNNGMVFYNDPAAKSGGKSILAQDFIKAWKKRFITVRV